MSERLARFLVEVRDEPSALPASPRTQEVLERVAGLQTRAAAILRRNGLLAEAARAEQFAVRLRLGLEETKATRRMHSLCDAVLDATGTDALIGRALDGAIALMGADFGNVQLCNGTSGGLIIAAQHGFGSEFLEYFATVDDDSSACGRAAGQRAQTVIVDVNADTQFEPHRDIAAAARFRAVQSTPLVDGAGRLRGVISTHFRSAHRPSERDLQLMQWYAERIGAALATPPDDRARLLEKTAAVRAESAKLRKATEVRIAQAAGMLRTNGHTDARELEERARRARERARPRTSGDRPQP